MNSLRFLPEAGQGDAGPHASTSTGSLRRIVGHFARRSCALEVIAILLVIAWLLALAAGYAQEVALHLLPGLAALAASVRLAGVRWRA